MGVFIDHYRILGLPSGEEGLEISEKEITKAYRFKALELHPDKKRDDPNAVINFQKLQASYEILKNEKTRKAFDDVVMIRVRRQKLKEDSIRRRMMDDDFEEGMCWGTMYDLRRTRKPDPEEERERERKRMMDDLEEERVLKRMMADRYEIKRRMMSDLEERKRRTMFDIEEIEDRIMMSEFEERERRRMPDLAVRKRTPAYAREIHVKTPFDFA